MWCVVRVIWANNGPSDSMVHNSPTRVNILWVY